MLKRSSSQRSRGHSVTNDLDQGQAHALLDTISILSDDLQELKEERARLRHERLQFQKLHNGMEEMLRSWSSHDRENQHAGQDPNRNAENTRSKNGDPTSHAGGYNDNRNRSHSVLDAKESLVRYNNAWEDLNEKSTTSGLTSTTTVPWPVDGIQANNLGREAQCYSGQLPREIRNVPFQLCRWNAFSFFVRAFGLRPCYCFREGPGSPPRFNEPFFYITAGESGPKQRVLMLKAQLSKEKLRWHSDRLKKRGVFERFSEEEKEYAKAVWSAVMDASKACEPFI